MLIGFNEISNTLQQNHPIFVALSMLIGLITGSFLNVVIYRLPKMIAREWHHDCLQSHETSRQNTTLSTYNLAYPHSTCPQCGHAITALENIPLVSYLILKGHCRACHAPIGMRYPLVELLTAILMGFVSLKFGYTGATVFAWIFTGALVVLSFIDLDTQLLPDDITLPLLWLGLLFNLNMGFTDIKSSVMGAMAGYLILWSIYWLFKLTTKKEGMGYGDFKLLAAIGAWFGWQLLPAVILLSSVLSVAVGLGLIIFARYKHENPIPFGPFLATGGFAALFFGQQLSRFYSL